MVALGSHLDVAAGVIDDIGRQRRARIFYSIYNFEVLLAEVLQKPQLIFLNDLTISTSILANAAESALLTEVSELDISPNWLRQVYLDFSGADKNFLPTLNSGHKSWRGVLQCIGKGIFPEYFPYRTPLYTISHRIGSILYLEIHRFTWSNVQSETDRFGLEMRKWRENIA